MRPASIGSRLPIGGWKVSARERDMVRANDRLALKGARDKSNEAVDYAKRSGLVPIEIDPVIIECFARLMREKSSLGMPRAVRLISAQSLSRTTRSGLPAQTIISGQRRDPMATDPLVRKSVQEWCRKQDSNL